MAYTPNIIYILKNHPNAKSSYSSLIKHRSIHPSKCMKYNLNLLPKPVATSFKVCMKACIAEASAIHLEDSSVTVKYHQAPRISLMPNSTQLSPAQGHCLRDPKEESPQTESPLYECVSFPTWAGTWEAGSSSEALLGYRSCTIRRSVSKSAGRRELAFWLGGR